MKIGTIYVDEKKKYKDCIVCNNKLIKVNACKPLGFCIEYDIPLNDF